MRNVKPSQCALCGFNAGLSCITSHQDPGGESYDLYECANCSVQFFVPLKNPGAKWYAAHERYAYRNHEADAQANLKQRSVIDFFKGKKGRVLDVGCGTGHFLAYAREQGWETWGIDFDQDAIRVAKEAFGLTNLEVADVKTFAAQHPTLRFDLITFFDVLEHLDDHNEFIAAVKNLLAPGGVIGFSMPYRHCWRTLIQGDVPPNHLTRWDERSVTHFLNRSGFSVSNIRRFPASLYLFVVKMRFKYGSWTSIGLVRKAQGSASSSTVSGTRPAVPSTKVRLAHLLAKVKDCVIFGIPALLIWLAFLPTRKRYTDLVVIATRL